MLQDMYRIHVDAARHVPYSRGCCRTCTVFTWMLQDMYRIHVDAAGHVLFSRGCCRTCTVFTWMLQDMYRIHVDAAGYVSYSHWAVAPRVVTVTVTAILHELWRMACHSTLPQFLASVLLPQYFCPCTFVIVLLPVYFWRMAVMACHSTFGPGRAGADVGGWRRQRLGSMCFGWYRG